MTPRISIVSVAARAFVANRKILKNTSNDPSEIRVESGPTTPTVPALIPAVTV